MKNDKAARRPSIRMIDSEADCLSDLALSVEDRFPDLSEMLLDEIGRATLFPKDSIPPDVVTMGASVDFVDETSGTARTVRIVFPRDADIEAGRISILTPVGAGLIGLRTGQSILWPDRDGHERRLTIAGVRQPGG